MKDASKAMFENLYSTEDLTAHLDQCIQKYQTPSAQMVFKSLIANKENVCETHTSQVFNEGCKASQRGESSNSGVKGSKGATVTDTYTLI